MGEPNQIVLLESTCSSTAPRCFHADIPSAVLTVQILCVWYLVCVLADVWTDSAAAVS
jgi:hypothetical protein